MGRVIVRKKRIVRLEREGGVYCQGLRHGESIKSPIWLGGEKPAKAIDF